MRIGLIDVDGHHFPNLAIMKIASYHKQRGDEVEFVNYLQEYDVVYKSKVFSFSREDCTSILAERVIEGGTGYGYSNVLPECVEHVSPDYDLYPVSKWYDGRTAYGFTTRGCVNHCGWCVVPVKEGYIRKHAAVAEFLSDKKRVVLMDNNILAHTWGLEQIEELIRRDVAVDFNQGLDARRIADSPAIAELLSRVKYIRFLRIACDTAGQIDAMRQAFEFLGRFGFPAYKVFVYCLVREDLKDAENRVIEVRKLGGSPFAMPFRDYTPTYKIGRKQQLFAFWVNQKRMFNGYSWTEFQKLYND